jgi:hypothetical protein
LSNAQGERPETPVPLRSGVVSQSGARAPVHTPALSRSTSNTAIERDSRAAWVRTLSTRSTNEDRFGRSVRESLSARARRRSSFRRRTHTSPQDEVRRGPPRCRPRAPCPNLRDAKPVEDRRHDENRHGEHQQHTGTVAAPVHAHRDLHLPIQTSPGADPSLRTESSLPCTPRRAARILQTGGYRGARVLPGARVVD